MHSPSLLFFLVASLGCLLGLLVDFPILVGCGLFATACILAWCFQARVLKAVFVCLGILAFFSTISSEKHREFDEILKSLDYEFLLYEGEVLDLAETLSGAKVGLFKIRSGPHISGQTQLPFTVALTLRDGASALPIRIGDTLRVKGKISKAHHALSPGQMDGYWFGISRGVVGRISISKPHLVAVMDTPQRPSMLLRVKSALREHILESLSPREAGLILALIIGDTRLFDEDQQNQYRNIGAGHLLAVSGMQVSILSLIFYRLFLFLFLLVPWISRRSLARYPAVILTLVFIWSFVALCGAPPSALRAGLMTTLVLCASLYGWPTTSMDVLGASGLLILLYSPVSVVDPSLWLSFAAVFGLILAAQVGKVSERDMVLLSPERSTSSIETKIRAGVISSVGAGLLTLPFSAFYFGEISFGGLLVNLILVPIASILQTPAILLASFGSILGMPLLTVLSAYFAGALESICMTLDTMLGGTYLLRPLSAFGLLLTTTAAVLVVMSIEQNQRVVKIGVSLACLVAAFSPSFFNDNNLMRVSFLPVGQGDAAVVEIPGGKVMVIDGGGNHDNHYNPGEKVIVPFLRRRHIHVIDAVVLSHPDADHLVGLLPLFDSFQVRELWHSGFDDTHPLMAMLLEKAQAHGVRIVDSRNMSSKIAMGDGVIEIIAPVIGPAHLPKLDTTNNRSLVMKVSYKNRSILFPGDIEELMEDELVLGSDLAATIVKAPHHGSKSSSSEKFVKQTGAQHVVFCTGINNRFGFPHAQVAKRWKEAEAKIWDTAVNGETTFLLGRDIEVVKPFLATIEDTT